MTIAALPTPPSRSDTPEVFIARADALMAALPTLVEEINVAVASAVAAEASVNDAAVAAAEAAANAAAAEVNADAAAAAASAATASAQATISLTQAGIAIAEAAEATAQAGIATSEAATATTEAAAAAASATASDASAVSTAAVGSAHVGAAEAAKTAAEAARDAAIIGSGVYASEAAGRAAVADGVAFKVQGSGDVAAYEYRRTNSSTSVLIATYPSKAAVDNAHADIYLAGQNRFVNPAFTKDAVASLGLGGAPTGYVAGKSGNAWINYPTVAVVNKANKLVRTNKVLELAMSSTATAATDYQLQQTFDIPAELWGDTAVVARFVYAVQHEVSGITTEGVVSMLNAAGTDLGFALNASVTSQVGTWFYAVFDVPITNASARKVAVKSRTQAPAGPIMSGKTWLGGMFFDFTRPQQATFDRNLTDEMSVLMAAKTAPLEAADAIVARWKLGSNSARNALFAANPVGHATAPTEWGITAGGAGATQAVYSVEAIKTPFDTNQALRTTHYYNGTLHSDIQPQQTVDIPSEFWGDTTLVGRFIYYANRQSNRISCSAYVYSLDAAGASLGGATPTKVSTDGADNSWFPVIFNVPVTNAATRKLKFSPRIAGPTSGGNLADSYCYLSGVFLGWNRSDVSAYDRNLSYEMDARILAAASLNGSLTRQTTAGTSDQYTDFLDNLLPVIPNADIVCWGDSLTAAAYPAQVATLFSSTRSVVNNGVGGETSSQILARVKGHEESLAGISWAPGTIRLKTRRAVPPRTVDEAYRASWATYSAAIAEPSKVEFLNGEGLIGSTYDQLKATCSVSGAVLSATGHPFQNGDEVYFLDASLPSGMYKGKVYFVRDRAADSFLVSEFVGGVAISFGAGTATALGPYYLDWAYTDQATDVTARTHTNRDKSCAVLWFGANNITNPSQIKSDIRAAVSHLKTLSKRVLVMTVINDAAWIVGTTEYNNLIALNAWILKEYPNSSVDVREYLRSNYNPGLPQDVTDIANGIIPGSLRVDSIHLNTTGYNHVADKVYGFFNSRLW